MSNHFMLEQLREKADEEYRVFQSRLVPTLEPDAILGVRTPDVRALARRWKNTPEAADFMECLPHTCYDENNLHAFLIEGIRDFEECAEATDRFLPFVDNWATCDMMSPAVFKKQPEKLLSWIRRWMDSDHVYTVRFGIGMLMRYFLDERFEPEYLRMVAAVPSKEYYIRMMAAWYFATALAKQYAAALPYLEQRRLDEWTHKKAIQKALESNRVSAPRKQYLRTLR